MIRRLPPRLVVAAGLAIVVAACNGGTAGPPLADATAVITAALTSTEAAKSFHVQIAIDGEASVSLPIGGGSGASVDLTGTTISADIDKANSAARATFSLPGVLNLSGELIAVDGQAYLKTTMTGAQYRAVDLAGLPVDPTDTGALIDNLGDLLLKPGIDPVKGDDVTCGSKQCYTVTVDLDATELAALIGTGDVGLPVNLAGASLQMTIRVEKDLPYHLAGVSATLTMAGGDEVSIDMTLSKWDEPVSIKAPPADQVAPGL